MTPPGQGTDPSQFSPQQKLVLIYTAESTGASRVKCLAQGHNAVVRPGFELTTFGLRVKCLTQGHTTQWSGRGSNLRPLGYESDTLTTRPLCCLDELIFDRQLPHREQLCPIAS